MEMDREDGTESVLSFAVDVNENRAEGYKTHTLRPLAQTHRAHRNSVFYSGPNDTGNSGGTRVASEETDINGFPEPDGVIELSLEPKDRPSTSGHIRTADGETGYFGEINPDLKQNRNLHCSGAHVTTSGFINSENGEETDLWGFRASPMKKSEGTDGIRGTNGRLITSGETSGTRGNLSSCFISRDGPQTASGHASTLAGRATDVHASTLVIAESSCNPTTSAQTSGARGSSINRAITGDAANVGEINGNLQTAARTINTSDGEDADVCDFHGSPVVIGETVATGESHGDQTTSWGTTGTRWETSTSLKSADETVDIKETTANLATSGETAARRRTNINTAVRKKTPGTCETNISPCGADKVVDIGETSGSEMSGNDAKLITSGETAGSRRTDLGQGVAGPGGSLTTRGTLSTLDVKTAASVTGDPTSVKESDVSPAEADEPIHSLPLTHGVLPQDQVTGNLLLGKDAAKKNPECPVCPGVCAGKSSCCMELEMIPNGDLQMDSKGPFPNEALENGVRVGNCGYLVINRRSISGTSSIPVYSIRESRNATERPQEARSCSDLSSETISDLSELYIGSVIEVVSKQETEDAVGMARPRTLRTNPGQAMSLSCDSTPLSHDNAGYFMDDGDMDVILNSLELGRRQSAPDELQQSQDIDPEPSAEQTLSRRHGFTDFLTRSLFSWKPKESKTTAAASGWRIFGKISPKGNLTGDSGMPQQAEPVRRKNLEFEPLSTTGLILEDRPANLPAKSEEEAQRHRQQYNEMMAGAKRRELKEAQRKKKQMKERHRQEESIARAVVVWNTEILPNWENVRNTRRVRELWWQGLPPSIRGKIWSLAIGNELNITPELYEIFLSRAKEKWRSFNETGSLSESEDCGVDKESSLDLIKLDIFRTFPSLFIFQKGGPYHDVLHNVLGAYTCYRPDVGYVQGMSFIAAVLILNLEEADAFIAFANLLNKPCQMAFFRVDHDLMLKYFAAFEVFFEENLPKLFQHFQSNSLTPDFYLIDWIFTLYSKPLPLDVACRVWDLFCRDGEEALFRTALGILRLYQDVLLQMDFIHSAQFLSRLLQNTPAHTLFTCIANTHMISNNRRWNQVFSALMKDGPKETDKTGSPALRS
ncbi:hypothetical protein KOW79_008679 [Hemibagrus wyckioides]|uniref:Rab-GAP TBC domain-containing protein n=1 Tax=Hemibagrus wyckioides TaxID=337641 RepID=A0A9D3NU54_9TELE|nr:TBC1 domain family member 14 [Hemibagrus wyckioides]KAG7328735.1 hypothetical protein KOW79_008679 [Hemibagrus wyckioides]